MCSALSLAIKRHVVRARSGSFFCFAGGHLSRTRVADTGDHGPPQFVRSLLGLSRGAALDDGTRNQFADDFRSRQCGRPGPCERRSPAPRRHPDRPANRCQRLPGRSALLQSRHLSSLRASSACLGDHHSTHASSHRRVHGWRSRPLPLFPCSHSIIGYTIPASCFWSFPASLCSGLRAAHLVVCAPVHGRGRFYDL